MAEVSKTGVWIDTRTGKTVSKQPEEGIQLVAPGGEIDARTQAALDAAKAVEDTRAAEPSENTAKKASRKR